MIVFLLGCFVGFVVRGVKRVDKKLRRVKVDLVCKSSQRNHPVPDDREPVCAPSLPPHNGCGCGHDHR